MLLYAKGPVNERLIRSLKWAPTMNATSVKLGPAAEEFEDIEFLDVLGHVNSIGI